MKTEIKEACLDMSVQKSGIVYFQEKHTAKYPDLK